MKRDPFLAPIVLLVGVGLVVIGRADIRWNPVTVTLLAVAFLLAVLALTVPAWLMRFWRWVVSPRTPPAAARLRRIDVLRFRLQLRQLDKAHPFEEKVEED
jgi:hypothetical protein